MSGVKLDSVVDARLTATEENEASEYTLLCAAIA